MGQISKLHVLAIPYEQNEAQFSLNCVFLCIFYLFSDVGHFVLAAILDLIFFRSLLFQFDGQSKSNVIKGIARGKASFRSIVLSYGRNRKWRPRQPS